MPGHHDLPRQCANRAAPLDEADGSRRAWERLPLAGDGPLHAHDDGPAGITKVVLADWRTGSLSIGDVRFEFA